MQTAANREPYSRCVLVSIIWRQIAISQRCSRWCTELAGDPSGYSTQKIKLTDGWFGKAHLCRFAAYFMAANLHKWAFPDHPSVPSVVLVCLLLKQIPPCTHISQCGNIWVCWIRIVTTVVNFSSFVFSGAFRVECRGLSDSCWGRTCEDLHWTCFSPRFDSYSVLLPPANTAWQCCRSHLSVCL